MECYVGLDASLKKTSICVVDGTGKVLCEGVVDSQPGAIARFLNSRAPSAVRIGIETGPTSIWLTTELRAVGLPVICIDARHAKAVLKMQINKSDRNDAAGIARIMQTGWFKEVRLKGFDSHAVRALLTSRAMLVKIKRDLENQFRGLLKIDSLLVGTARGNAFSQRVVELAKQCPQLAVSVIPLLAAREAIDNQLYELDRKVLRLARADRQWQEFISLFPTLPGSRQILDLAVDLVLTSCGFGVPLFDYVGQRDKLQKWGEKKGPEGVREFWEKRNQMSIDGRPTHLFSDD